MEILWQGPDAPWFPMPHQGATMHQAIRAITRSCGLEDSVALSIFWQGESRDGEEITAFRTEPSEKWNWDVPQLAVFGADEKITRPLFASHIFPKNGK